MLYGVTEAEFTVINPDGYWPHLKDLNIEC